MQPYPQRIQPLLHHAAAQQRPRPTLLAALLFILLSLTLAACGQAEDTSNQNAGHAVSASTPPDDAATITPPRISTAVPLPGFHPLPTQAQPLTVWADVGFPGTIVEDGGCIYLDHADAASGERTRSSVVWPPGWGLQRIDGVVSVVNEHGAPVLNVGDSVMLGGAGSKESEHPCLQQPVIWAASPAPGIVTPSATGSTAVDMHPLPTQPSEADAFGDALFQGTLIAHAGCLYLKETFGSGGFITGVVWPHGFSLQATDGVPHLLNPDGSVAAQVGDDIALGGGFGAAPAGDDPASGHPCLQFANVWYAAPSIEVLDTPLPPRPALEPLPTRPATNGAPLGTATLSGNLTFADTCLALYVTIREGDTLVGTVWTIVWPDGYHLVERDGLSYLANAEDEIVAAAWEQVTITGAEVPVPDSVRTHPCLQSPVTGTPNVWIADAVTVTHGNAANPDSPPATATAIPAAPPTPVPLPTASATQPSVAQVTPPAGVQPLPTQPPPAPQTAWPDALLEGNLVEEDGCLYIDDGTPGHLWAVIWQFGWAVQERDGVLELVDGNGYPRARVGDGVGLGGSASQRRANEPPASDHPCLQRPDIWHTSLDFTLLDAPIAERVLVLPTQTTQNLDGALAEGILYPSVSCPVLMSDTVDDPNAFAYPIIWPIGYTLRPIDDTYQVLDELGNVRATLWDRVRLGGSAGPPPPGMESDPCLSVPTIWYFSSIEVLSPAE